MEQQNNKTDCRFNCDFYDWDVGTCDGACAALHDMEHNCRIDFRQKDEVIAKSPLPDWFCDDGEEKQ